MTIFQEVTYNSPEYQQLVALRRAVLRVPLGLDYTPEQLAADEGDTILGAFENNAAIGSLIIRHVNSEEAKLRQMAIDASYQGKGTGAELLAHAEQLIRSKPYHFITLHARQEAVPFYKKHGYAIEGAPFIEVTIPHVAMRKSLA